MSLRKKLIIYILSVNVMVLILILFFIVKRSSWLVSESINRETYQISSSYIKEIRLELEKSFYAARTLSQVFSNIQEVRFNTLFIKRTLEQVFDANAGIISLFVFFEPGVLSGDYNLLTWNKADGKKSFKTFFDYDPREQAFYKIPKESQKESLTGQYFWQYNKPNGRFYHEITFSVPILREGRFVGIVGVDIELERIKEICGGFSFYPGSYAFLISGEGVILSHANPLLVGQKLSDLNKIHPELSPLYQKYLAGKEFSYEGNSLASLQWSKNYFFPFKINEHSGNWYFGFSIPIESITGPVEGIRWTLEMLVLLALILVGLSVFFLSKKIYEMFEKVVGRISGQIQAIIHREEVAISPLNKEFQEFQVILEALDHLTEKFSETWKKLFDSEQRLYDILDFLPDPTFAIDRNKRVIIWNKAIEKMTGIPKEKIIGEGELSYSQAFYGKERPMLIDFIFENQFEIKNYYDFFIFNNDILEGESFYANCYGDKGAFLWGKAAPLLDQEGQIIGAIETTRDMTAQKKAEKEIKKLNEELEGKVIERTKALEASNLELKETLENLKRAQNQLVLSEKMVTLGQLIAGIAHEINTPLASILSSNEMITSLFSKHIPGLADFVSGLNSSEFKQFKKLFDFAFSNSQQISYETDRSKRKEVALFLEENGIPFARPIADGFCDLGNPDAIREFISLFRLEKGKEILEQVAAFRSVMNLGLIALLAGKQAKKVIQSLKDYARQGEMEEIVPVDIIREIETLLVLYQNKLKYGVEIVKNFEYRDPIPGNREKLNQVWINLLNNALQAMDYKGRLEIGMISKDGWVEISITDSGQGIPLENQSKIFEPFFTTKKQGEGMGLGLDICKKIIEKLGGEIFFSSMPGKTTFTVRLKLK